MTEDNNENPFKLDPPDNVPADDPFAVNSGEGAAGSSNEQPLGGLDFSMDADSSSSSGDEASAAPATDSSSESPPPAEDALAAPAPMDEATAATPEMAAGTNVGIPDAAAESTTPPAESQEIAAAPGPANPLEGAKALSEENGVARAARESVPASFPFSLLIEGHLEPHEKEKLITLLSEENMGVREIDLEPQFESEKILIPRISEYAGILLVQKLRNAKVQMRLAPSEEINELAPSPDIPTSVVTEEEAPGRMPAMTDSSYEHPAEAIVITPESIEEVTAAHSQATAMITLDTLTASATLTVQTVEAERSDEFQQVLENLQRELKYKAFHKGATTVVRFEIRLIPLTLPMRYRLIVTGVAARPRTNLDAEPVSLTSFNPTPEV